MFFNKVEELCLPFAGKKKKVPIFTFSEGSFLRKELQAKFILVYLLEVNMTDIQAFSTFLWNSSEVL